MPVETVRRKAWVPDTPATTKPSALTAEAKLLPEPVGDEPGREPRPWKLWAWEIAGEAITIANAARTGNGSLDRIFRPSQGKGSAHVSRLRASTV